jgi:sugar lactone lactonase YvrE
VTREFDCEVAFRPGGPDAESLRWLPEGPVWLRGDAAGATRIAWVAIQHGAGARGGSVNVLDLGTGANTTSPVPGRPGFLAETDRPGVLLVGLERRLALLDLATGAVTETGLSIDEDPRTVINDGTPAPFGVVFGTKDPAFREPIAGLFLWRHGDRELTRIRGGQTCSNGKVVAGRDGAWSLLDIDSPTRRIVRYALDPTAARLADPEVVADLGDLEGFPDGMVMAPDGSRVIVALFDPGDPACGEARLIDLETGRTDAIWRTPGSPQVTCPALVADAGRIRLVLTTAAENMTQARRARHPEAGALFWAETPFDAPPEALPAVPVGSVPRAGG